MTMTKEEKKKLARKLLKKTGYSKEEIEKIIEQAWGKEASDDS